MTSTAKAPRIRLGIKAAKLALNSATLKHDAETLEENIQSLRDVSPEIQLPRPSDFASIQRGMEQQSGLIEKLSNLVMSQQAMLLLMAAQGGTQNEKAMKKLEAATQTMMSSSKSKGSDRKRGLANLIDTMHTREEADFRSDPTKSEVSPDEQTKAVERELGD